MHKIGAISDHFAVTASPLKTQTEKQSLVRSQIK